MGNDLEKNQPVDKSTQLAIERTNLATERTVIAAERTLMAWIRTSLSLIGFGFTIYKFFQYLGQEEILGRVRPQAPKNLGLTLIALGTLALVAAAWQHRSFLNRMGLKEGRYLWSIAYIVAILVVIIGAFAFIGVFSDKGPY